MRPLTFLLTFTVTGGYLHSTATRRKTKWGASVLFV